ncbi:hypothetical protein GCM10028832_03390 [Streptomyces sparsus]
MRPAEEVRLARAALCRVGEPGETVVGKWLAAHGPVETLAALREGGPLPGVSAERLAGLRARARTACPEADLATLAACSGRFLVPGDQEWPGQLDDLGDARPVGLWVRGPTSLRLCALRSVALVGARACTEYGTHVASVLGSELAERGWCVVSGAAYGVDAAAHRGALAVDGATVAVLACGVDRAYPPGNQELVARIAEQGVLVAELPPGAHPTRSRFVLRNRVISGSMGEVPVAQSEMAILCSSVQFSSRLSSATGVVQSLNRVMRPGSVANQGGRCGAGTRRAPRAWYAAVVTGPGA